MTQTDICHRDRSFTVGDTVTTIAGQPIVGVVAVIRADQFHDGRTCAYVTVDDDALWMDIDSLTGCRHCVSQSQLMLDHWDCPKRWHGEEIVNSMFIPRRPGYLPYWIAVVASERGTYHVVRLLATNESTSTRYDMGSREAADAYATELYGRAT